MKLFSLILSVTVFFITLYFFSIKVSGVIDSLNDVIYISLLVVLMAICITGVIINWEFFKFKKQKKERRVMMAGARLSRNK